MQSNLHPLTASLFSPMLAILDKLPPGYDVVAHIECLRDTDLQGYRLRCELYRKRIAYQQYGDLRQNWISFHNRQIYV